MFRAKQQSRLIASLLALAVFVSQSSVVFATMISPPANDVSSSHCMMDDMSTSSMQQHLQHAKNFPDCCKTSDCANNFCVPGVNYSSSAIFNTVTLLHSSIYAQTILDTSDQLHSGVANTSLYRPPRQNA
ncbi:MAG: hypothetical protein PVG75_09395 [Thioalkalispiraceae bacterium]|jgi:hypothetical protein